MTEPIRQQAKRLREIEKEIEKVSWLDKEKQAWKPPERLTVSEWADKYRIMDSKTSAFPGKWRTDRTPYLREVMDQYNNPEVEEIVFCCSSQVGKTETLLNIQGYIIDQDPNPALIVYPTLTLAEFASENRIMPMVDLAPTLKEKYDARASARLELQFNGMYLVLSGANSAASLASRPVRYVLFDEVDKFPAMTGKEADPISLAKERTKTFYNRKHFMTSTPTIELGAIWQELMSCAVVKQYHVPCPHCGHYDTFQLKNIKWPEQLSDDPQKVRDVAYYVCAECGGIIEDKYKAEMLRHGEWRPMVYTKDGTWESADYPEGRIRKVGYHLNAIYSPWLTFGDVGSQFLNSKDFPEKLRNFINSWLGEPWRDKASILKSDIVLEKQAGHERGQMPDDALMLTAGVDIQLDHMWYEIRAWGERVTSWLVDYGVCETWDDLEEILFKRRYRNSQGQEFMVSLAGIDTGYRTDEVYEFCSYYPNVAKPIKGASNRLTAPYNLSRIDKGKFQGLMLYNIDTHYFKDFIHGRLRKEPDELGSWSVFKDCPREYAEHITSEQKVITQDRRTGRTKEEWLPISSHAANHLLDCAVYSAAVAEIGNVRYLRKQAIQQQPQRTRRGNISKGLRL